MAWKDWNSLPVLDRYLTPVGIHKVVMLVVIAAIHRGLNQAINEESFRLNIYIILEDLQADLDKKIEYYNLEQLHT